GKTQAPRNPECELYGTAEEIQSIDLRCESGMDQPAGLHKLQILQYTGAIQHMTAEDFDWMSRHWKKLVDLP
ncbi:hypothetical protein BGZ74_010771, partial [Mortierella antarctica]